MNANTNATNTLIDRDFWPDEPVRMWWDHSTGQEVTSARTTLGDETIVFIVNWAGEIIGAWRQRSAMGTGWMSGVGQLVNWQLADS